MYEDALREFEKLKEISGNRDAWAYVGIACTLVLMGRQDEARAIRDNMFERSQKDYIAPSCLATIDFSLGDTDQGFTWLEKGYEERDNFLPIFLKHILSRDLFGLHSDPRYMALLKKMNLGP